MNASIFFKSRRRPIHLDQVERVVLNALEPTAPAAWSFLRYQNVGKAGLRQFHRLEDKTIHLGAGLRLTLSGYLEICQSPKSK